MYRQKIVRDAIPIAFQILTAKCNSISGVNEVVAVKEEIAKSLGCTYNCISLARQNQQVAHSYKKAAWFVMDFIANLVVLHNKGKQGAKKNLDSVRLKKAKEVAIEIAQKDITIHLSDVFDLGHANGVKDKIESNEE